MSDLKVQYVSVLTFNVEPDDFPGLSREAVTLLQRKGTAINGLVESVIMGNEPKTQMLIVSQWSTQNSWSAAQWDEDVARSLAVIVESALSFEVHSFEPVAVVRPATPSNS